MNISQIQDSQLAKLLMRNGFLYPKLKMYIEIYLNYEAKILSGHKKTDVITWTADTFRISERTVYYVIKKIENLKKAIINEDWSNYTRQGR